MKLLIEVLLAFHFVPHLLQKNLRKFFQHSHKSLIIHLQGIKYRFQKHGFLSNALSFLMPLKIPNKFTQFQRK